MDIFKYIVINKHHVNFAVERDAIEGQKFSDVYCRLFQDPNFTSSMKSFLKALDTFEFNSNKDSVCPNEVTG